MPNSVQATLPGAIRHHPNSEFVNDLNLVAGDGVVLVSMSAKALRCTKRRVWPYSSSMPSEDARPASLFEH